MFKSVRRALPHGAAVVDKDTGKQVGIDDLCCAVMFNVMGFLHEKLKSSKDFQLS